MASQSETSITITWTQPLSGGDPIPGYKIQWNGGSGSVFSTITTHVDLLNLSYTRDTTLSPGTTYEFRVIASNEVGDSTPSDSTAIKAASPPDAPDAPTKLSADKTSIQISWTAPDHDGSATITGYKIYWDNNTGTIINTAIETTSWQTLTFS